MIVNIGKIKTIVALAFAGLSVAGVLQLAAPPSVYAAECGGITTALIDCGSGTGKEGIIKMLAWFIRILTVIIGIVAVGAIVYASILYASAHDSEQQVNQAKEIIRNVVIGLVLYALMGAAINFLVPGAVFS